jgi:hypothetical protein
MPRVLLRVARLDQFRVHPAAQEADAELGEPREGAAGKRGSIVGADPLGQAVLVEQPGERRPHQGAGGLEDRLSAEEVPTEVVGHGERVEAKASVPTLQGAREAVAGHCRTAIAQSTTTH